MKQKVFLTVLLVLLVIFGYEIYDSYIDNHQYYLNMIGSAKSRKIFLGAIVGGSLPVLYVLFAKKIQLKKFLLTLFGGLMLFSFIHVSQKGGLVGPTGSFMFIVNTSLLFALGAYFLVGLQAVGTRLAQKILRFSEYRIQEMLLSFGLGLGALLLFVQFLILTRLLYRPVVWIVFIGLGVMIYFQKQKLKAFQSLIETEILAKFSYREAKKNWYIWIPVILLLLSVMYYIFGFQLSFIPYSTAWDANHAYMYFPKVFAENHGTWPGAPGGTSPMLWYAYITFFFALMEPLKEWFRIGPSTVGVAMNFLSGILALFFGLALTNEIIDTVSKKKDVEDAEKHHILPFRSLLMGAGWFILLLRLTSGMGAFLVFIDNKTDLGVMSLTLLALLSGIIFFNKIQKAPANKEKLDRTTRNYIAVSGVFFALSTMAKATAFQDVLLFGLLLLGAWVGALMVLGGTVFFLGFLAKNEVLTMKLYLKEDQSVPYMILGALLALVEPIRSILKRQTKYLTYIAFWAASFVLALVVFKLPQVIYSKASADALTPKNVIKGLFLGAQTQEKATAQEKGPLLAGSYSQHRLLAAAEIAPTTTTAVTTEVLPETATGTVPTPTTRVAPQPKIDPVAACKARMPSVDKESLFDNLQKSTGGGLNEDLERYIGFGQRNFPKPVIAKIKSQKLQKEIKKQEANAKKKGESPNTALITQEIQNSSRHMFTINLAARREQAFDRVAYAPLRAVLRGKGCFGRNADAKILCENAQAIESFDIAALETQRKKMDPDSDGFALLSGILHQENVKTATQPINTLAFQDEIIALRSFYQDRTVIVKENGDIAVPYRYFVPLNISVINKLQNPSSYYTDIGFVFFMLFLMLIVGTIYAATYFRLKKDKQGISLTHEYPFTFALHLTAIGGWVIWRGIGSAILWYGIGLIAWTLLANVTLLALLYRHTAGNLLKRQLYYFLLIVIAFRGLVQLFLNFIRISSQGGESVFVRYKGNTAEQYTHQLQNGAFSNQKSIQYGYKRKDVFDMQFGHYNKFIEHVKDRKDEDGVLVAGTYIQYFLHNQKNMMGDGLLTRFRERMSDYDACNTYMRLQEKNVRYLVIDGNIPSVVMGDGNSSLRDRVFAKIDPVSQEIEKHGALSMIAKMVNDGYIKMLYSNALNAKYAYMLSDQEILSMLQSLPSTDPVAQRLLPVAQKDMNLFRSKMAIAKFFPQDSQYYFEFTARILQARLQNGQAIGDIADVMGRQIDEQKIISYLMRLESAYTKQLENEINEQLTQNEFFILQQYTSVMQAAKAGNQQLVQQFVQQVLSQSIGSSSQILAFELVE